MNTYVNVVKYGVIVSNRLTRMHLHILVQCTEAACATRGFDMMKIQLNHNDLSVYCCYAVTFIVY